MQKIVRDDAFWMRRALDLALKGRGRVHPNPMVGAVLVRAGKVLAEGYHARFGGPHAEVCALKKFSRVPADAVLYVSLEPCAHTGKTPPCTDEILRKGVRHVVVGARDCNPRVAGKGIRLLRRAGVDVRDSVLSEPAQLLNRDFNHWVVSGRPYVTVKVGQSLDGAIATATGQSQWITSEASRRAAMEIRAHADAVVVGVQTVIQDDPRLTVRLPGAPPQPLKIVIDPHLRTPVRARIFSTAGAAPPILVASPKASRGRRKVLARRAEILEMPFDRRGSLVWAALLKELGRRGLTQILIEGGGETIGRALDQRIVQEVHAFIAPVILGGRQAVRWASGQGLHQLSKARSFRRVFLERTGPDLHYTGIY